MKRIALFALAVLAILVAACKKTPVDNSSKPSVAWEANPSFTMMEIGVNMDARVVFTVPDGVSSFVIKVTEIPIDLRGLLKKEITSDENKRDLILDLVGDSNIRSAFPGFVSPSGLAGAKTVTLDFAKILNKLTEGQLMENDDRFTFDISMVDDNENRITQTVRFRWTAAPEISFEPNRKSDVIYLIDTEDYTVENDKAIIKAAGKVENIILTFGGSKADPALLNYVKSLTKRDASIDFTVDEKVAKAKGLATAVSDFKGKTDFTISLGNLLMDFILFQTADKDYVTDMTVEVTDALGKKTTAVRHLGSEYNAK